MSSIWMPYCVVIAEPAPSVALRMRMLGSEPTVKAAAAVAAETQIPVNDAVLPESIVGERKTVAALPPDETIDVPEITRPSNDAGAVPIPTLPAVTWRPPAVITSPPASTVNPVAACHEPGNVPEVGKPTITAPDVGLAVTWFVVPVTVATPVVLDDSTTHAVPL